MKVYSQFQTDARAERDGVWVDIGEGAAVKVARFNNPDHEQAVERLQKPYRNILRTGGRLPRDVQDKIAIEAMAEAILLDWRGLEDEAGEAIAYGREAAVTLLTDLRDFRNTVSFLAMEAETFRKQALEQAEKNSSRS